MNSPIVIFALCFAASQINPAFAQDIEPATPPVISTDRTNIDVQICKGLAATHPLVPFPVCIQIIDLHQICPYAMMVLQDLERRNGVRRMCLRIILKISHLQSEDG